MSEEKGKEGEAEKLEEVIQSAKAILQKQEQILAAFGEVNSKQPAMNGFATSIQGALRAASDKGVKVPPDVWDQTEKLYHMQFEVTRGLTDIWQEEVRLRALYKEFLKALAELFWKLSMT